MINKCFNAFLYGNNKFIEDSVKNNECDLDRLAYFVFKTGNKNFISYILTLYNENDINNYINYFYLDSNNSDYIIYYACRNNNLTMLKYALGGYYPKYELGLLGACKGGHMKLAKMMLELGAKNYNAALDECMDVDVASLIIKRATNYNNLKKRSLEFKVLYVRTIFSSKSKTFITPQITKSENKQYNLLKFYHKKIPDIDRLIHRYLY